MFLFLFKYTQSVEVELFSHIVSKVQLLNKTINWLQFSFRHWVIMM